MSRRMNDLVRETFRENTPAQAAWARADREAGKRAGQEARAHFAMAGWTMEDWIERDEEVREWTESRREEIREVLLAGR